MHQVRLLKLFNMAASSIGTLRQALPHYRRCCQHRHPSRAAAAANIAAAVTAGGNIVMDTGDGYDLIASNAVITAGRNITVTMDGGGDVFTLIPHHHQFNTFGQIWR